jgi:hypothetical protein
LPRCISSEADDFAAELLRLQRKKSLTVKDETQAAVKRVIGMFGSRIILCDMSSLQPDGTPISDLQPAQVVRFFVQMKQAEEPVLADLQAKDETNV